MYKKLLVLIALVGFLVGSFGLVRAVPYDINLDYYALHNMIENGDFSTDTNSDGLADGFFSYDLISYSCDNDRQNFTVNNHYSQFLYYEIDNSTVYNHKYYMGFDNSHLGVIYILASQGTIYSNPPDGNFGFIWTANNSTNNTIIRFYSDYNGSAWVDNLVMIDLTNTFGAGNEPSLSDFETYYLPDEWFQDYESYVPQISELYTGTDLANDDTAIDWTKALISKNGTNIDLDFYMYLDYEEDVSFNYEAYTIPLHYYGSIYNIIWVQDENNDHLFKADFSDPELYAMYKEILFDRRFSEDNFVAFPVISYDGFVVQPRYWLDIKSTFIYNVSIGSIITSVSQINYNDTNPINSAYVSFFDQDDNFINPSLELPCPGDLFNSRIFDEFQAKYNNIKGFKLSFDLLAYDYEEAYPWYYHCVHEIGVFSVSSVLLFDPNEVIYGDDEISVDDLDTMFPQAVVEWYDFGGQIKNLINQIGKYLYTELPIQEMIDTVETWTDYIGTLSAMIPPTWWAIIGGVVGVCFLGLVYTLVERWF